MGFSKFPPVSCSTGYRVIMEHHREQEIFNICVGDNMHRIFTSSTLPADIKLKTAVINAIPCYMTSFPKWQVYTNPQGPEYDDVGWCIAGDNLDIRYYCLILSETRLWELRGEATHDARSEGEEEGEGNP